MSRLPTLFISHGAPTFALERGRVGQELAALGQVLPRPEAVLVVSPHWMTAAPRVGAAASPATIHDFGGFDPALYRIRYPVSGHPVLAARAVVRLIEDGWDAHPDPERGLDHGVWAPLLHLYPTAAVPAFQVSLPLALDARQAWSLGRSLAPLADEGVLIIGSGSLTHNLHDFRMRPGLDAAYVKSFTAWVHEAIAQGEESRLLRTLEDAPHARRAHPTPEHFWPLLVAAGASGRTMLPVRILEGGVTHESLSMDSIVFGDPNRVTGTRNTASPAVTRALPGGIPSWYHVQPKNAGAFTSEAAHEGEGRGLHAARGPI